MDETSRRALLDLELWTWRKKESRQKRIGKISMPLQYVCRGEIFLSRATIRKHLRRYKRDSVFTKFILKCDIFAFIILNYFINKSIKF